MTQRLPLVLLASLFLFASASLRAAGGDEADKDGSPIEGDGRKVDAGDAPGMAGKLAGGIISGMTSGSKVHEGVNPDGSTEVSGSHLQATRKGGGQIPNGISGMLGGSHALSGGMSTSDTVPTKVIAAEIRAAADGVRGWGGDRIRETGKRVIAEIEQKYPERVPAVESGQFATLVRLQLEENAARREVMRQGGLTRQEKMAQVAAIEERYRDMARQQVKGEIMSTTFHQKFGEVGNEYWSNHPRPEGERDRPSRPRLEDLLRANPRNPGNWAFDAQDKLESGDKAGARASLDKAISLGGNASAFGMRGAIRLDEKDYDGAYRDARKALELKPGDKDLLGLLKATEGRVSPGLASAASGGFGAPAGAGSSGLAAGAHESRAPSGLSGYAGSGAGSGRARDIPGMTTAATLSSGQKLDEARRLLSLGDSAAAIAMARRALEQNPGNASAYGFLSEAYARGGDYKRALESAKAGLALSPRDAALLNAKAFAENRSRLYREALESSNGAIEADSRSAYSYANRAHAYGGLGDKASMLSDINRAAGIDPRFEKAAADAAALQLPSNADILFMFPGENPSEAPASAPSPRRSSGLVFAAAALGGVLLALGLLSTVLAPLKDSVVSAFTKASRRGPSVHALEEESTPEAPPSEPGLIRGQYEISRQIGAGGMGMVYEGTDRSLGRRVAIKKMRDELRMNPRERERFIIEARTVASLHHPNIVDIYAIAEEGDDVYLVFEYVDGRTVHDVVQAKGRLNQADTALVARAAAEALAYAHANGVIHRDMKPSNIMVTADGRIKVMDFGIARMAKDALTRYSMTNTVVGTPPYMAPEQEQGVVRKESDVYSLAICSYEMLTGKLPFAGIGAGMLMNKINMSYVPPSRAIAGLPEALDEVFLKAFQADPDQRYRTPMEFSSALDAALGGTRSARSS